VEPSELAAGWDRDRVLAAVLEHDVPCFSGSCSEVYLECGSPGGQVLPFAFLLDQHPRMAKRKT